VPAFVVYCIAALFAAYQTRELATRMDLESEQSAWTDTMPEPAIDPATITEPMIDAHAVALDDPRMPRREAAAARADSLRATTAVTSRASALRRD
jgi:hypothetical protein